MRLIHYYISVKNHMRFVVFVFGVLFQFKEGDFGLRHLRQDKNINENSSLYSKAIYIPIL